MKKHKFNKTEQRILDYLEKTRAEGNEMAYWSSFKLPWGWAANPYFRPFTNNEERACESLVQRGFIVEVNHKTFMKNHRSPGNDRHALAGTSFHRN